MKKHETVRKPLSANEVFELGIAVFQQLPRNLDPDKVRADLGSKGTLGRDLGKFFRERYMKPPALGLSSWKTFYWGVFGKEVEFTTLSVPQKPAYECWPIVVFPGLVSNNEAFDASKKLFGDAWRYADDLNTVRDVVKRPKGPYVVWAKATVEADPDLTSVSADQIAEQQLDTLTLLERLLLGLKHFDETKQHLDVENVTLCAGSRYADGGVPGVGWGPAGRGLCVGACGVRLADPHRRARAAVVPEA